VRFIAIAERGTGNADLERRPKFDLVHANLLTIRREHIPRREKVKCGDLTTKIEVARQDAKRNENEGNYRNEALLG
jgi:hypothetical protein